MANDSQPKQDNETRNALAAWLKELEAILVLLMPEKLSCGFLEPDFRHMVIPSPSLQVVEAAIDAVSDYALRQELAGRARRLEQDLTNFDCNKRRFHEECDDMSVAEERQANGTLSDTPEALKQVRRNLKGDIARLKEIIDGVAEVQPVQQSQGETVCVVVKKPTTQKREDAARLVNEIYRSNELKVYAKKKGKKSPSRSLAIAYIRESDIPGKSVFYERGKIIRNSVLTELAKSSKKVDVDAAWNSILTIAKTTDPMRKSRKQTGASREAQAREQYDNGNKPRIVPTIGDASSRYNGW